MQAATTFPQTATELAAALVESRRRTLALVEDLDEEQLLGPKLAIVNPPLWEIGHVAWFQERWNRRHLRGLPSLLDRADGLYDSMAVAHDTRWDLELVGREGIFGYLRDTLHDSLDFLGTEPSEEERYFLLLALFHEDMHAEAFAYTRQTHGYPPPEEDVYGSPSPLEPWEPIAGDVEIEGGTYELGATRGSMFVFDNEKWAHPVRVEPFRIARTAVSQGELLAFVRDDGYRRPELWTAAGRRWLEESGAEFPLYWRRESENQWYRRVYDRWMELETDLPAVHVNGYEADAYCRWAGRRLPTEVEWELAASTLEKSTYPWGEEPSAVGRANLDGSYGGPVSVHALAAGDTPSGLRQMMGNVWEWTDTDFGPFPGFVADPYEDYSQPWFGDHKVLRGGCWATRFRMLRNTWRNFYKPDRRDVWAGFRTCAISSSSRDQASISRSG